MKCRKILIFIVLLIMLCSCVKITVEKPEGFAVVKGSRHYKAVSPEGVVYKVRYVRNYPEKNLEFWGRALKKQLVNEGYQFVKEAPFTAGKIPGLIFEWTAPYGNADYIYLTAVMVSGKKIAVAEAAAEYRLFNQYRAALVKSLTTLKMN